MRWEIEVGRKHKIRDTDRGDGEAWVCVCHPNPDRSASSEVMSLRYYVLVDYQE